MNESKLELPNATPDVELPALLPLDDEPLAVESAAASPSDPPVPASVNEPPVAAVTHEPTYRIVEPEPEAEPAPGASEPRAAATAVSNDASVAAVPPCADAGAESATFRATGDGDDAADFPDEVPNELPRVDEVWSRWAEWKEPAIWTGVIVAVTVVVAMWPSSTVILLLGGLAFGLYHVAISLEIPVRVTAEHAVREFFVALGHRLPNYRRAWLLLSRAGRESDEFTDYRSFRRYWNGQLARLTTTPVWVKPLDFRIEDCRCRYNPEKTFANLRYTLRVYRRGSGGEPIAEFAGRASAVKGPDGQWYLNGGGLPPREA